MLAQDEWGKSLLPVISYLRFLLARSKTLIAIADAFVELNSEDGKPATVPWREVDERLTFFRWQANE